jgi:AmmeMemoRadiSam system protein B
LDSERFDKFGDACNKNAISALLKLADYYKWQSLILYQSNSSNVTNDTNSVVGYASVIFY